MGDTELEECNKDRFDTELQNSRQCKAASFTKLLYAYLLGLSDISQVIHNAFVFRVF
jgi:hypothetical protein